MTSSYLTQLPSKFGEALRVLRKRARLTQDEMGRAVGYSREQIARLESGARLPDPAVVVALFVPALFERHEDALIQEFLALAHQTRNTTRLTVTHALRGHSDVHTESVPDVRHHLPAPLLPLIGRDADLAALPAVLADSRLLTLVGAPGIGSIGLPQLGTLDVVGRLGLPGYLSRSRYTFAFGRPLTAAEYLLEIAQRIECGRQVDDVGERDRPDGRLDARRQLLEPVDDRRDRILDQCQKIDLTDRGQDL